LDAAWRRRREVVIWPGPPTAWLKLLAPGLLDRIVLRPAMRQGDRYRCRHLRH